MTDDDDVSEMWRDVRVFKQEKKHANATFSTQLLTTEGVKFTTTNGIHLKIQTAQGAIDYWPSTGLWILPNKKRRRGVNNLLNYLKEHNEIQSRGSGNLQRTET